MKTKPSLLFADFTSFGVVSGIIPGFLIGLIYALKASTTGTAIVYIIAAFCFVVIISTINCMILCIITILIRGMTYTAAQYRILLLINTVIMTLLMSLTLCIWIARFSLAKPVDIFAGILIATLSAGIASQTLASQYIELEFGKKKKREL
jgi:hypothetical protein